MTAAPYRRAAFRHECADCGAPADEGCPRCTRFLCARHLHCSSCAVEELGTHAFRRNRRPSWGTRLRRWWRGAA